MLTETESATVANCWDTLQECVWANKHSRAEIHNTPLTLKKTNFATPARNYH